MIGVWSATGDTTAAELPLATRPVDRPEGAIAIVGGQTWTADARAALEDGAAALLITEPDMVDPRETLALDDEVRRRGRAAVVERRRLEMVAVEPTPEAVAMVAECVGRDSEIGGVLRDALGWVRRLAGADPEIVAVDVTPRGSLAQLRVAGASASVLVDVSTGVEPGGFLRVTALGLSRVEVVVDLAARTARATVGSESGIGRRPAVYEAPRRVALRRLLTALEESREAPDLAELGTDETLARTIRGNRSG